MTFGIDVDLQKGGNCKNLKWNCNKSFIIFLFFPYTCKLQYMDIYMYIYASGSRQACIYGKMKVPKKKTSFGSGDFKGGLRVLKHPPRDCNELH